MKIKRLTTKEQSAIWHALNKVESAMERDDSEPSDSSMAYTDGGNFLHSLSEEDFNILKSAIKKFETQYFYGMIRRGETPEDL